MALGEPSCEELQLLYLPHGREGVEVANAETCAASHEDTGDPCRLPPSPVIRTNSRVSFKYPVTAEVDDDSLHPRVAKSSGAPGT